MILVDSNVLIYAHDKAAPKRAAARQIIHDALTGKRDICITLQNLIEFYNVLTNPRRVKQPLSPSAAKRCLHLYWQSGRITKLYPTATTMDRLLQLQTS